MDRQPHDYAAAMTFSQQQQPAPNQQFGFPPQHQQFPPSMHGPPFIPPNASLQQYPFPPHVQRPHGLHPHPPPHLPHHFHHQPPPSGFPSHMPSHLIPPPFPGPPPPAPPPSDPEFQKVIDKFIEYYRKNGPEFETMIRERQQDNPAYSFLFGGEGHNYYRYKLWLSTLPSGGPYNPSPSMDMLRPPPNPMMNPAPLGGPVMHQPFAPPFYEHHHHSQPFAGPGPSDFDLSSRGFKGLSGPLPSDVAMELSNVLSNLTGTKESIKGAKIWFMQRSPFAPALAEALRDRVFAMDDSERQLHIVYLANDILFDSLQRRNNPLELDNEALAFKPVLGSMLGRIYHNPQNRAENQSRLQKILQFWGSKEVYDHETITSLENEMIGGSPSNLFAGPSKELSSSLTDPSTMGLRPQASNLNAPHWQPDKQGTLPSLLEHPDKLVPSIPSFPGPSMPMLSSVQPATQQHLPPVPNLLASSSAPSSEKLPPYPLFPPGLIPGMVKKMQIGSGVPYSPMSPLDIPTMIPPSSVSESEILGRVSKFFKEIGEVNPSEGPTNSTDDYDDYERASPIRKGGACIPPPPNLQVDPETGAYADGSVDRKSGGSGRLGLGASADPNEESQYDDVYSSYRKQRSTNYHTTMSARAATAK